MDSGGSGHLLASVTFCLMDTSDGPIQALPLVSSPGHLPPASPFLPRGNQRSLTVWALKVVLPHESLTGPPRSVQVICDVTSLLPASWLGKRPLAVLDALGSLKA